jgi:HNH endonuclease
MSTREKQRRKRIREYVINRDGSLCCYCDKVLTEETITLEHIIPDSENGTFNATNLTIACYQCNNKRGNKPFFAYINQFDWGIDKINKYRRLYDGNLKIRILNVAKEKCLLNQRAIPNIIIKQACKILNIEKVSFSDYIKIYHFAIDFDTFCDRKEIKFNFEQLIRIIEADNV